MDISNGRSMLGIEFAVFLQVWHCLIGVCTQQSDFLSFVSTFDDSVTTSLALLII